MTSLPPNVTDNTEWMKFTHNPLVKLDATYDYLETLLHLNFSSNKIEKISDRTVEIIAQTKCQFLDLSDNKIRKLPKSVQMLQNSTEIWLAENNFVCDCSMLWMLDWMSSGQVKDFNNIKCGKGKFAGKYMHSLDGFKMGCFPLWQKILIGVSVTITVLIVIAIIGVSRRWNEVKWLMFLHFDILDKNDAASEILENKESDALLSYRYVVCAFSVLKNYVL